MRGGRNKGEGCRREAGGKREGGRMKWKHGGRGKWEVREGERGEEGK